MRFILFYTTAESPTDKWSGVRSVLILVLYEGCDPREAPALNECETDHSHRLKLNIV